MPKRDEGLFLRCSACFLLENRWNQVSISARYADRAVDPVTGGGRRFRVKKGSCQRGICNGKGVTVVFLNRILCCVVLLLAFVALPCGGAPASKMVRRGVWSEPGGSGTRIRPAGSSERSKKGTQKTESGAGSSVSAPAKSSSGAGEKKKSAVSENPETAVPPAAGTEAKAAAKPKSPSPSGRIQPAGSGKRVIMPPKSAAGAGRIIKPASTAPAPKPASSTPPAKPAAAAAAKSSVPPAKAPVAAPKSTKAPGKGPQGAAKSPGGAPPAAPGQAEGADQKKKGEIKIGEGRRVEPRGEPLGDIPVTIYKGEINVLDFLRVIAVLRGVPVIYDSDLFKTPRTITVVSDLTATYEILKAILEVNKYTVTERKLPDGSLVIEVTAPTTRATSRGGGAAETPIVPLEEGGTKVEELRRDEVATIVAPLKYAEIDEVRQVLAALLGGSATSKTSTGAGYAMVDVKRTNTLIIKAKYGLADYIREIIKRVDVPLPEDEQIIEVIDVKEADVNQLVRTIEEVLRGAAQDQMRGRTTSSLSSSSRLRSSSLSRTSSFSRSRYSSGSAYGVETILVPDERTQRIVVFLRNSAKK